MILKPTNLEPTNLAANDELFFTAVCYVLEDLSPSERDVFEQRLLEDQQARERLVRAVEFCQSLSQGLNAEIEPVAINSLPTVTSNPHGRRRAVWASLALAASLLLAVGIAGIGNRNRSGADFSPSDSDKQLAVAWVNSAALVDAEPGPSEYPAIDDTASDDTAIATAGDWLFEAVNTPRPSELPQSSTADHEEG